MVLHSSWAASIDHADIEYGDDAFETSDKFRDVAPRPVTDRVWIEIQAEQKAVRLQKLALHPIKTVPFKRLTSSEKMYRRVSVGFLATTVLSSIYFVATVFMLGVNYRDQDPFGIVIWFVIGLITLAVAFASYTVSRRLRKIFGGRGAQITADNVYKYEIV